MNTLSASVAQSNIDNLIRQVAANHEPVVIAGTESNAVLVSQEDWAAIQETLHLLSIPGMIESIREGLETPLDECQKTKRRRGEDETAYLLKEPANARDLLGAVQELKTR